MTPKKNSIIALIPARLGSERILKKNIKDLKGHPLIAYTISAAKSSEIFDEIFVSTDDLNYSEIAEHYGANAKILRPKEFSGSKSPDIEWVKYSLDQIVERNNAQYKYFSILRPTSPFRKGDTIKRAWKAFKEDKSIHSLRAIELVKQHPGKVWKMKNNRITPLFDKKINGQPWHSSQYASLPEFYIQNASLEIAKVSNVYELDSISGYYILPFITHDYEGFDINNPEDWILANHYINNENAELPLVEESPFFGSD